MTPKTKKIIIWTILAILMVITILSWIPEKPTETPPPPSAYTHPSQQFDSQYTDPQNLFEIAYLPQSNEYSILVLGSPFETVRKLAEDKFLELQGNDSQKACSLKVKLGTPYFANPDESARDYSLSFCNN